MIMALTAQTRLGKVRPSSAVSPNAARCSKRFNVRPYQRFGTRLSPYAPAPAEFSKNRLVCNGLFGLGLPELAVIAGVAALVFGPSKLPELGKGLGKTVKSFQTAAKEFETELKAAAGEDTEATKPPTDEKATKQ